MKSFLLFLCAALLTGLCFCQSAFSQCNAPELVKGADKYNELVCKAYEAARAGENKKSLELFLAAAQEPVLESPNIRLFGKIAKTYAKLGQFNEADLYLRYDNLSLLWMIGIVRCQLTPGSKNESLIQDGKRLLTEDSKHMSGVLCGPVFDEFSYFRDRDADSFVPAARAILQYDAIRKEIDSLRQSQRSERK